MHSLVVPAKTATLFLLIAAGWIARRRGYFDASSTRALGRFVVDFCLPPLVFVQMLSTVSRATWQQDRSSLALGGLVMLVALASGWASARLLTPPESRPTFAFLVAAPNWIYLPLPIAQALYGDDGVRAVLLSNVSVQILLWTLGVATLRGSLSLRGVIDNSLLNPGILSAAVGVLVAWVVPGAGAWKTITAAPDAGLLLQGAGIVLDSLSMAGSLTIPLSLLLIGAQLGSLDMAAGRTCRCLPQVVAARLLLAPAATLGLFLALHAIGWRIPRVPLEVCALISAMPIAVSCTVFAERFGGDVALSARATFQSTAVSLVSVPVVFWAMRSILGRVLP
jgi:predicted permease